MSKGDKGSANPRETEALGGDEPTDHVRRFRLQLVGGGAPTFWDSSEDRVSIGADERNGVALDDSAVSRFHCELQLDGTGLRIVDLDSSNGTVVDGVRVRDAYLHDGSVIAVGRSQLQLSLLSETNELAVSSNTSFGDLVGVSLAMRRAFAVMERVAQGDATVLIEGESGTGKEGAAESIHAAGDRRDGPFIVVDCGAMPGNLLDTELFGHEKGAFTGAVEQRIGAFEEATGGTVFLDEIGELPLDLQPKLLRALESRKVRRIGSNEYRPVDVRVIAATNRDLRRAVNDGGFRADLYYRLAVVRLELPALRHRPEDVPILAERILERLGVPPDERSRLLTRTAIAQLRRGTWPGNVRELRNYLESWLVLRQLPPIAPDQENEVAAALDPSAPYREARRRGVGLWERRYLDALRDAYDGDSKAASEGVGLNRANLWRLMRKHGVKW